jgi:transposase
MKFETVRGRWVGGELNQAEAGEILGVSERTFRRWYLRHEEEGLEGLNDRRLGKPSSKRVPAGWAQHVERLYRERYRDFTAKHFHEYLVRDQKFAWKLLVADSRSSIGLGYTMEARECLLSRTSHK